MAITCPKCGKEFDVTLFQFGNAVECDCGTSVDISVGHLREAEVSTSDSPSARSGQFAGPVSGPTDEQDD